MTTQCPATLANRRCTLDRHDPAVDHTEAARLAPDLPPFTRAFWREGAVEPTLTAYADLGTPTR